jgi:hypothetical protein
MSKTKISQYDPSAGNNTDVNGVNINEGCAPSGINNAIREVMAALKRFETGADGDSVTVGGNFVVSGTATLSTTSTGPINGTTIPSSKTLVVTTDIGTSVQAYDADTAKLDVAQAFSVSQRGTVTTDNDGSFDMNATNNFLCTPTGAFTLTFTNITAGQSGNIVLVNGSNYTVSAAAATKVAATTLAAISATGTYWLAYFSPDGTNVYVANTAALA